MSPHHQRKLCYKCTLAVIENESLHEGLHPSCFCKWFEVDVPQPFEDIVARSADTPTTSSEWDRITSSFFHGRFRKYSAQLGRKSYLLKVQQAELPELPAMEYLCNQIARSLGLWVPDHHFIRFQNELETFVCRNFMQDYPQSNLVHIYRYLEKPEQFCCEGLLDVIQRHVPRFEEIRRFVVLTLFDALIGNHDRHGRNLGLIQSANKFTLAPFYDNPSYIALESPLLLAALHEPRGAIATKATLEPTMRDYVTEWERLGYSDVVHQFKSQIDLEKIQTLISDSFVSPKRQQAFSRLIQRRYKELCDETQ